MQKFLIFLSACMFVSAVYADCVSETVYVACKPGYYLYADDCVRCPSSGGIYGTTVDNNTGGITSCYIPSGNSFSDTTGSGTYAGDCYYSE